MKKILFLSLFIIHVISVDAQSINGQIVESTDEYQIIKVWGTHEERGYAAGYLMADGIYDIFSNYLLPAFGSYYDIARNLMQTDMHIKIDSIYIYEAAAMAQGVNDALDSDFDYIDVLLANSFLDLQNFLGKKNLGLENGCSSLISWGSATENTDLNGKSVISRHLDWNDQPAIVRNQVIVVHFPSEENEQPWLLIGFAGQMSVLSGLNQNGLALMQHNLADVHTSASINKAYEPIWFSLRKAIEMNDFNQDGFNNALDINAVINQNINGYADAFIITGVASAIFEDDEEIASIIEVAPSSPFITIRNTDYEDYIPDKNLYAANFSIARNDLLHFCDRYDSIMHYIGDGLNIGTQENWNLMLNHSSSCAFGGWGNIQFMQYVPENNFLRIAFHSIGGPQACENIPYEFSTTDLFQIPVDVEKNASENNLVLYPNPAETELNIYVPEFVQEDFVLISNADGRLIKTIPVRKGKSKISIDDLKPGLYLIKLKKAGLKSKLIIK
jgi:hypothetical protein